MNYNNNTPKKKYDGPDLDRITLDALTLFGDSGTIKFSVRKGYPQITFFAKKENQSDRTVFVNAPMKMEGLLVLASYLKLCADSKEDVKFSLYCYNKDWDSDDPTAKKLHSIVVVARVGDDVILGLKKDNDTKAQYAKHVIDNYMTVDTNDGQTYRASVNAKVYANVSYLHYVVDKYTSKIPLDHNNSQKKTTDSVENNGL